MLIDKKLSEHKENCLKIKEPRYCKDSTIYMRARSSYWTGVWYSDDEMSWEGCVTELHRIANKLRNKQSKESIRFKEREVYIQICQDLHYITLLLSKFLLGSLNGGWAVIETLDWFIQWLILKN